MRRVQLFIAVMVGIVVLAALAGSNGVSAAATMTVHGIARIARDPVPDGAVVAAVVRGTQCGSVVLNSEGTGFFSLDVLSDADQTGCAVDGDALSFTIDGQPVTSNVEVIFRAGTVVSRISLAATGGSPTPTPSPTSTPTPTPSPTVTPTPSPTATPSPTPSPIPSPTPTPTPSPTATITPSPTPSPTPAATPPSGAFLPSEFHGTVTMFGKALTSTGSIATYVNGTACGSATLKKSLYGVSAKSSKDNPSCGRAGDTVTFKIGDYWMNETGTWQGGIPQELNLTGPKMDSMPLTAGCGNQLVLTYSNRTAAATVQNAVTPAGSLTALWRWNPKARYWEVYAPGAPTNLSTLKTVNRLDAVRICTTANGALLQPKVDF